MNYLCARQRGDGRWDYTYNRVPWGYCCEYEPIAEDGKFMPAEIARAENEKHEPFKHKHHTDGHATKEEACECYKQYLLDIKLRLEPEEPGDARSQYRCEICRKFTACMACVGPYRMHHLCPEHQTRECVESVLVVGESWES